MSLIRNKITRNLKSSALLALNFLFPGGVPILMYHSIGINPIFFTVKPEEFRKQMSWLYSKKYRAISLRELADIIGRKEKLPSKTVVLTFDDGFEDNYFESFPILKKYGFSATIFLPVDFIGKEKRSESTGISLKCLNWEQIRMMHNSGSIDFEPHGCSHKELPKISLLEAKSEISNSRKMIEESLNKKCYFFAYPRGKYSPGIIDILRENNFLAALTVNPGRVRNNSNLFKLPRQSIDSATGKLSFLSKVR